MEPLSSVRAAEILERFSGQRVGVFGDFMLDRYVFGEASRISPEAPIPILRFQKENLRAGGAANVVRNLASLGSAAIPIGVVGDDAGGKALRESLAAAGVPVEGILRDADRPTTEKTRFRAGHHPVARIDREDDRPVSATVAECLLGFLGKCISSLTGIIVSDYEKGVVTPATLSGLLAGARECNLPVFVDPKTTNFPRFEGATLLTPNLTEAAAATGWSRQRVEEDLEGMAKALGKIVPCRALLVTRGEKGMVLFESGKPPMEIPTTAREVYDVTGAGDTVIAVSTLAILAGANFAEASLLANRAAGKVVGKLGTATVTREEILNQWK